VEVDGPETLLATSFPALENLYPSGIQNPMKVPQDLMRRVRFFFSDCVTYPGWNEKNMHDLFGSDCSNQNANNNDQFPNTQMVRKNNNININQYSK
jgi:hypothetical protein